MAWFAATLCRGADRHQADLGVRRAEVLAAAGQAAVLLAVGGFILVEGVRRLFEPPEVASGLMVVFGVIGLLGNVARWLVAGRCAQQQPQPAGGVPRGGERRAGFGSRASSRRWSSRMTGWLRADALASILIGSL